MKYLYAVFPSLNHAALVKQRLLQEGVYLRMCRTPECLIYTGCSFALMGDLQQMELLRQTCHEIAIPLRGVFEVEKGKERHAFLEVGDEEQ